MNEDQIIAALVALAKAHPYAAAALAMWLVLSTGWKAQPKEKRDAWAKMYPRPVSVLRFALELLPDVLGAGRVLVFGVLRGVASRESSAPSAPPSDETPPDPRSPGFSDRSALVFVIFAAGALLAGRALTGCSARDALRDRVRPIGLYELQHPLHGRCHEVGVRAPSETLNRELVVYGGVCVNALDAGAASDAEAGE